MLLPGDEEEILAFYPPASREKILGYLENGRVFLLPSDESPTTRPEKPEDRPTGAGGDEKALRALVVGSSPKPYRVSLSYSEVRCLESADCDCPAAGLCEHAAAVWIKHLRDLKGPLNGADFAATMKRRFAESFEEKRELELALDPGEEPSGQRKPETAPEPRSDDPERAAPAPSEPPNPAEAKLEARWKKLAESNPLLWDDPVPSLFTPTAASKSRASAAEAESEFRLNRLFKTDDSETMGSQTATASSQVFKNRSGSISVNERWKLGFLLRYQESLASAFGPSRRSAFSQSPRKVFMVSPTLFYIKTDGTSGRRQKWNEAALTEKPGPEAAYWLGVLLSQGGSMELDPLLLLADLPDSPPLPELKDEEGNLVVFADFDRCLVSVRPAAQSFAFRDIAFEADVSVVPENPEVEAGPGTASDQTSVPVSRFYGGLRFLYFRGPKGLYFRRKTEARLVDFLEFLESKQSLLQLSEVELIEKGLAKSPLDKLEFRALGKKMFKQLSRGLPLLSVEAVGDGFWGQGLKATLVEFSVLWEKGAETGASAPNDNWLQEICLDETGTVATLLARDLVWETEILNWLFNLFEGYLERKPPRPGKEEKSFSARSSYRDSYRALPPPGPYSILRDLDENRSFKLRIDLRTFLSDWAARLMEEGFSIRLGKEGRPSGRGRVSIRLDRGIDWLDFQAEIEIQAYGAPGARKRAAQRARDKALSPERRERLLEVQDLLRYNVAKTGAGFVLLSPTDTRLLEKIIELGLEPDKKNRISANNIGLLAELHREETSHLREISRARELVDKLTKLDALEIREAPEGFGAKLRAYQKRGFSWLLRLNEAGLGACLADDMGLGKTVQTLAFLLSLRRSFGAAGRPKTDPHQAKPEPAESGNPDLSGLATPDSDSAPLSRDREGPAPASPNDTPPPWPGFRALLVVPVSTLGNWEAETRRFAPELKTYRHHGPERARDSFAAFEKSLGDGALVLVSYATLRLDLNLFAARTWDVLIIDEAQTIKNPDSATFEALKTLAALQRVSLTGTPLENSVLDLWAQMDFVNPGMLGSLKRFRSRFASAIEERNDLEATRSLRAVVSPFLLRRRKEEVAKDLPPKEEVVLYCELNEAQRKVYEDVRDAYRLKVDESVKKKGVERSAITILEALLRLRQVCLFPGIVNPVWDEAGSTKLDFFRDLCDEIEAEGNKALVFSQFTEVLGRLRADLEGRGREPSYLDGSTGRREEAIRRFQEDPACRFFLISLKAGGVGINLTAADYVFLFDPWWNPAAEAQAVDRAHRIGRDKPVIVYRLITRDTVEEKILALQARKRELAEEVFSQDEGVLKKLSPRDLLGLFG